MNTIIIQHELRPALPTVFGAKDYREFRQRLEEIDRILTESGIENRIVTQKVTELNKDLSLKRQQNLYRRIRQGFRYNILLGITGYSTRNLSIRVADSQLFLWFTYTETMGLIRPLSKSSIDRYEKMFTTEEITALIHECNRLAGDKEAVRKLLYQETELRFDEIFGDTTCVKANIHFPVDWVLFRDATRTLIKAIMLIRSHGLYHRIRNPKYFITAMNKLCIKMTHARKKKDSRKTRKKILRSMKELIKTIEFHARNYCQLLKNNWEQTDWSEIEVQIVLNRIQNILDQLPAAVKQAHERIIGERRVANKDKILSFYEPDVHVLVRGKAGAEVEFGNALYLAEQSDGLIVDWDFIRKQPPGDNKLVEQSLERIKKEYGPIMKYTADRGFSSPENNICLEQNSIFNAICPRSVDDLEEQLKNKEFCRLQKRRGPTEARIGIFKNAYLGKPLRSKGFKNRKVRIEWCILVHNLWKLGVMAVENRNRIELESSKPA